MVFQNDQNFVFAINTAGVVPKESPRASSIVQIIFFFSFSLLRSLNLSRVFKTCTFRNIILSIVLNYLTPFRIRFKPSLIFSKLQHNSLAFVSSLKGLLIRVHYPKLRNTVLVISL